MSKEERLKKCETIYDLGHVTTGNAIDIWCMMLNFSMRFRESVLIYPPMYDMFYKYIDEQPYHRNNMQTILNNMEEFKSYFKPESKWEDRKTRETDDTFKPDGRGEGRRLNIEKSKPSLYNPIMMMERLSIPCVECACDPNVWETRRWWMSKCKHDTPQIQTRTQSLSD